MLQRIARMGPSSRSMQVASSETIVPYGTSPASPLPLTVRTGERFNPLVVMASGEASGGGGGEGTAREAHPERATNRSAPIPRNDFATSVGAAAVAIGPATNDHGIIHRKLATSTPAFAALRFTRVPSPAA